MEWFNIYGLAFIAIIMLPNIVFSVKSKGSFQNLWKNKAVELLEQIGRYACFVLMIFNIPHFGLGFSSVLSFTLYLILNGTLIFAYCVIWIIFFKKNCMFRALTLSIIPSLVFLLSGILSRYLPLLIAASIFAPCHITISYKNAALLKKTTSAEE